ncbi:MAG: flagellar assembly protein FliW [Defluviitaleaceae bacterium]|nr:flagellar assembly protein FliW [Defluviitaleaceae bacterium]
MKKMETKHFGEISYDPEKIIHFPEGLPGFPEDQHFLLMSENEDEELFFWLQSTDNGNVAFTLMDVYKVLPDYDPQVEEEEIAALGELDDTPLLIYNIVVIPEYVRHMRVNLLAPVVINLNTGIGKQIICTSNEYAVRFMIFEELERAKRRLAEEKANAGTNA